MTFAQWAEKNGITMTAHKGGRRRKWVEFSLEATPWTVTLARGDKQLRCVFFMGLAHQGKPPSLPQVLRDSQFDISSAGETFKEFCGNCGYDLDSRRAYHIFGYIRRDARRLLAFLGAALYYELCHLGEEEEDGDDNWSGDENAELQAQEREDD